MPSIPGGVLRVWRCAIVRGLVPISPLAGDVAYNVVADARYKSVASRGIMRNSPYGEIGKRVALRTAAELAQLIGCKLGPYDSRTPILAREFFKRLPAAYGLESMAIELPGTNVEWGAPSESGHRCWLYAKGCGEEAFASMETQKGLENVEWNDPLTALEIVFGHRELTIGYEPLESVAGCYQDGLSEPWFWELGQVERIRELLIYLQDGDSLFLDEVRSRLMVRPPVVVDGVMQLARAIFNSLPGQPNWRNAESLKSGTLAWESALVKLDLASIVNELGVTASEFLQTRELALRHPVPIPVRSIPVEVLMRENRGPLSPMEAIVEYALQESWSMNQTVIAKSLGLNPGQFRTYASRGRAKRHGGGSTA